MKISNYAFMAVLLSVAVISSGVTSVFLPTPKSAFSDAAQLSYNVEIAAEHPDGVVFAKRNTHNFITNISKNMTATCYGNGLNCTVGAFKFIALGNGTLPTDAVNALNSENAGETCNLSRQASTSFVIDNSSTTKLMNVSNSYTFTANGTCTVNTTALFNASSTGIMLAAASFTTITMQNGDRLNVNSWNNF